MANMKIFLTNIFLSGLYGLFDQQILVLKRKNMEEYGGDSELKLRSSTGTCGKTEYCLNFKALSMVNHNFCEKRLQVMIIQILYILLHICKLFKRENQKDNMID